MKHVHFLGICGTAMGAVASAMARQGYVVTGTDANVYPPMSTFLENEGIQIFQGYNPANIPADTDLVVIGNAMSRGNIEVEAVLEKRLRYMSLPETMKEFFLWGKRNLVVTGTHGKTTTTSMLAWMLEANGRNPSFMIGGIARNLGRGGRFTDSEFCVLEGDEYDTSFFDKRSKFLHYLPEVVIINNIEMDHADIYANVEEIKLSFKRLLRAVPRNGIVFINADCPNCADVRACAATELRMVKLVSVGMAEDADIRITDLEPRTDGSSFTLTCKPAPEGEESAPCPLCGERFNVPMIGDFNVRNAAMAACAAAFSGLSPDEIRTALDHFEGVARRQEVRGTVNGVTVVMTSPTTPPPSVWPLPACASVSRRAACGCSSNPAATPPSATSSRTSWPNPWPKLTSPSSPPSRTTSASPPSSGWTKINCWPTSRPPAPMPTWVRMWMTSWPMW